MSNLVCETSRSHSCRASSASYSSSSNDDDDEPDEMDPVVEGEGEAEAGPVRLGLEAGVREEDMEGGRR